MIRRKYNAPKMNVIKVQTADVITSSTREFDGEWVMFGSNSQKDEVVY